MSEQRDPPRLGDPESGADPLLRQVLQSAQRGLGGAARAEELALGIERAVYAAPPPRGSAPYKWLTAAGLVSVVLVAAFVAVRGGAVVQLRSTAPQQAGAIGLPAPPGPPSQARAIDMHAAQRAQLQAIEDAAPNAREPVAAASPSAQGAPTHGVERRARGSAVARKKSNSASASSASAGSASAGSASAGSASAGSASARSAGMGITTTSSGNPTLAPDQTAVPPELQLVSDAQRALRSSPADALQLCNTHARAYPDGRFVQEREEIAIEALYALGNVQAARTRAQTFLARYPQSTHAARITRLLAGER